MKNEERKMKNEKRRTKNEKRNLFPLLFSFFFLPNYRFIARVSPSDTGIMLRDTRLSW